MRFTFHNDVHGTTARASTKNYQLSQRQVRRLWTILCGDLDCNCGLGGVQGPNRYRLKKQLFTEGAEICPL